MANPKKGTPRVTNQKTAGSTFKSDLLFFWEPLRGLVGRELAEDVLQDATVLVVEDLLWGVDADGGDETHEFAIS